MSNYNSIIQQNNTELEDILDTVNALPDAGPSVETCTVNITRADNCPYLTVKILTVGTGGGIECLSYDSFDGNITLNNVVCDSIFYAFANNGGYNFTCNGVTALTSYKSYSTGNAFVAPSESGAVGTLHFTSVEPW